MPSRIRTIGLVLCLAATVAAASGPARPDNPLRPPPYGVPLANLRIVNYAIAQFGKQVGNGECWTLANVALEQARAEHPDVYVWGRPLRPADRPYPGDIVRFENVRFENGNGSLTVGHHTAVLLRILRPGVWTVLHCNWGTKNVTMMDFDFNTVCSGQLTIYRPRLKRA